MDTSSAVAEVTVAEAVVNRVLLRFVDRKTNEVGGCSWQVGVGWGGVGCGGGRG